MIKRSFRSHSFLIICTSANQEYFCPTCFLDYIANHCVTLRHVIATYCTCTLTMFNHFYLQASFSSEINSVSPG